jgi:hypothetical protein
MLRAAPLPPIPLVAHRLPPHLSGGGGAGGGRGHGDPVVRGGQVPQHVVLQPQALRVQVLLAAGGGDRHRRVPQPSRGEGGAIERLLVLPRRPRGVEGITTSSLSCFRSSIVPG